MNEKIGKVGFVNVCDQDYVIPLVDHLVNLAVNNIKELGYEVITLSCSITSEVEAQTHAKELLHQDVDCVIIYLGAWAQCPEAIAAIREIEHLPFCLWGIKMCENSLGEEVTTNSYVAYAMIKGSLDRMGYKYSKVLGNPDENETLQQISDFIDSAVAIQRLKRTRIGQVGGFSVGVWPATYDHVFLRKMIGPNVIPFDSYTVIMQAEKIDSAEVLPLIEEMRTLTNIHPNVTNEQLETVARLTLSLNMLVKTYSLHAMTVKCQYEFSKQYGMIMCVPLAMLTHFGIISACESDIPCLVSMIILNYLSGETTAYGDVFNHKGQVLKFSPCGYAPFELVREEERLIAPQTRFEGFKGINTQQVFKPGKITFLRLVEDCGSYHVVFGTGTGVETDLRQGCMPALDVILDGDMDKMIANYAGQHYAFCYGDQTSKIIEWSNLMGIRTVII